MKKFFSFILALVMMISLANAQTVEHSTFFENTSITLYGGGITTQHAGDQPFFWDGAKNIANGIRPLAGVELTKYVTPVLGLSLEGLAMFNTTGSNTWIDQSNVVGNLKLNLSNWFGGYLGEPRRVEVVLVPGLGWGHDYGDVHHRFRNYLTYNTAAELNINLGKQKAWQINIKPVVMWNNYHRELGFHESNLQGRLQIGLTYKFGSRSKKSHNFKVCPYTITDQQYAAAVAQVRTLEKKVNELSSREPQVVEKVIEKEVIVEKTISPETSTLLSFTIGSSELSPVEKAKLETLVKSIGPDQKIYIIGSADSATGTDKINNSLAEDRANTVKNILVKEYGISTMRIDTNYELDINSLPEASRAVVINLK